jgi:hypothetical protein
MNWAIPSAPLGLTARGSNKLSFQISRAKKISGMPFPVACVDISPHISVAEACLLTASVGEAGDFAACDAGQAKKTINMVSQADFDTFMDAVRVG